MQLRPTMLLSLAALLAVPAAAQDTRPQFEPTWESLNARKSPEWFRDAKLGIFIHWGVYSVPSICDLSTYSEWYLWWLKTGSHGGLVRKFHEKNYGADFGYEEFAPMFRAELWDPQQWAGLFKRAGARYVVLVSKHHDGFALWPNEHAGKARGYDWNSVDTGPKRDLCGELAEAVRAEGLRMGFYYSFMEWDNPLYVQNDPEAVKRYVDEMMIPQIEELVTRYQPAVFWPDGEWNLPDTSWRSTEILEWLYENCANPEELVVNDRWGRGLRGQVGDYYTTEYGSMGNSSGVADETKPFEECRGIGHSFAFNRLENYDAYLTRDALVQMLIDLVAKGGGMLLNLGPTADGRIPVIQQDRLVALGEWLEVNGEAIYGTRKGLFRYLPWGRSTTKGNTLYLHVFDWPADHRLMVPGLETEIEKTYLLHDPERRALEIEGNGGGRPSIDLLGFHPFRHASVIALELAGEPKVVDRIFAETDGSILLRAETAELTGRLQLETGTLVRDGVEEPRTNVGYWTEEEDTVSWSVRVEPGQRYRLEVDLGCEPGSEGGILSVHVGSASLDHRVDDPTESWHDYRIDSIGELTAGESADVTVTVRCERIARKALVNLRWIRLEPVR